MSEIETSGRCCTTHQHGNAPPLSLADMPTAFDGWGESYPLPQGGKTEPKNIRQQSARR